MNMIHTQQLKTFLLQFNMSYKKYVNPKHTKSGAYANDIKDIKKKMVCPFCPEVFPGVWHKNPILKTKNNWLITRNMYPYTNTQEHFLIVGTRHIEQIDKLSQKDLNSILSLSRWVTSKFNLPGGMLAMRFGDTQYTGATVVHLHAHLVVPKRTKNKIGVVNFPVG
jgi:diadenosine tetraphosphate (Ap4A) HIT family hydrolase